MKWNGHVLSLEEERYLKSLTKFLCSGTFLLNMNKNPFHSILPLAVINIFVGINTVYHLAFLYNFFHTNMNEYTPLQKLSHLIDGETEIERKDGSVVSTLA